jgi:hypothetical protein
MNKIEYTIKFYRNSLAEGMVPREAVMLCAVAQLTSTVKECTSHEVTEITGDSHPSVTLRRMTWWLNIRETKNAKNKKVFYYSLKDDGVKKLRKLIS